MGFGDKILSGRISVHCDVIAINSGALNEDCPSWLAGDGLSNSFAIWTVTIAYTTLEVETNVPGGAYQFSVSEAAPVLCRGGARSTATICDCPRAPLHRSFLAPAVFRLGRERTGGGFGRGRRFIAGNAHHPGTRPGQPAIKGTLNTYGGAVPPQTSFLRVDPVFALSYGRASPWQVGCSAHDDA